MTIFLTGATGYIGSYIAHRLLEQHGQRLSLLVRAKSQEEGAKRLWQSLQMHMDFPAFYEHLRSRVDIYLGDLTERDFGLEAGRYKQLVQQTSSVIHCAASLNRKSNKACFNTNLRGTLEVVKLARAAQDTHGLRRFSDVSTVAVSGEVNHQLIREDEAIDWNKSDYDPYSRTKKFCEHMVHELLPDVPVTVFRPSTVLGDSRYPETTQFDMVRAFVFLAKLPVLPLDARWRMDIVPANYVADGIVAVHMQEKPEHGAYNLSTGAASPTYRQITDAMRGAGHGTRHLFAPGLLAGFEKVVDQLMDTPRGWGVAPGASLMKVFIPYLAYDTVFDNTRIQKVLGRAPAPFTDYCFGLFEFATRSNFKYPYKPWPEDAAGAARRGTGTNGKSGSGKSGAGAHAEA
jgi:thioester reductase-like protein